MKNSMGIFFNLHSVIFKKLCGSEGEKCFGMRWDLKIYLHSVGNLMSWSTVLLQFMCWVGYWGFETSRHTNQFAFIFLLTNIALLVLDQLNLQLRTWNLKYWWHGSVLRLTVWGTMGYCIAEIHLNSSNFQQISTLKFVKFCDKFLIIKFTTNNVSKTLFCIKINPRRPEISSIECQKNVWDRLKFTIP
jgi:hypothetical protein